ncbi:hypothetical protein L202_04567 [Cryptococcus amylolentus CBS 6039]|uniref:Uncharacterized protein n=2 Tax=Cryptococcus amylolentus TaxID=104669 RepID=A0A1E3HM01_9TREE|nr:hypothetical protein L202_04567 [Cryptococcus amylolentus CBS 6039]ODN77383.1 hypothetical protein L202_04567 [Cryptococcus amylolentus CBS 6039]ODN95673.1 hypothetical protein I350_08390 [Cryptococcus amylolentus CBS 6273]
MSTVDSFDYEPPPANDDELTWDEQQQIWPKQKSFTSVADAAATAASDDASRPPREEASGDKSHAGSMRSIEGEETAENSREDLTRTTADDGGGEGSSQAGSAQADNQSNTSSKNSTKKRRKGKFWFSGPGKATGRRISKR